MSRAREDAITVLQSISSPDTHYEWYVATGGGGNLAAELWTFWMKYAYVPHSEEFLRGFSPAEHEQLERFTQFFESRLKLLPRRFEELMTDMYWGSIREYAQHLLEDLGRAEDPRCDDG